MTIHIEDKKFPRGVEVIFEGECVTCQPPLALVSNAGSSIFDKLDDIKNIAKEHEKKRGKGHRIEIFPDSLPTEDEIEEMVSPTTPETLRHQREEEEDWEKRKRQGDDYEATESKYLKE